MVDKIRFLFLSLIPFTLGVVLFVIPELQRMENEEIAAEIIRIESGDMSCVDLKSRFLEVRNVHDSKTLYLKTSTRNQLVVQDCMTDKQINSLEDQFYCTDKPNSMSCLVEKQREKMK